MQKLYLEQSPKEKGWYLGLKENNDVFPFYIKEPKSIPYNIDVPFEFKGNPNYRFELNPSTWIVTKTFPISQEGLVSHPKGATDLITWEKNDWCQLTQITKLNSILPNVYIDMEKRLNLVGKKITFGDKVYKIISTHHHIHRWTIYNIENVKTKKWSGIKLENGEWFIGGNIKVKVEIET